jgi:sortase A
MASRNPAGRRGPLLAVEVTAWIAGVVCLAGWTFAIAAGNVGRHESLARFAAAQSLQLAGPPDQSLWSPERIQAWNETQKKAGPAPLAILRIRRIGLEVPILEGTDDWTLNRGAGHIADTAAPGAEGNSGIAAHRDGFFRPLKDVRAGDILEIETLRGNITYRIDRTWIVDPEDVSVLDPTPGSAVTLVTCYPFYFVGAAPQRYIVRAVRAGS